METRIDLDVIRRYADGCAPNVVNDRSVWAEREALRLHVLALCAEVERLRDAAEVLRGSLAGQAKDYVDVRAKVGVLLGEIADTAIAFGMMTPEMRGAIDGPNAILFLQQMRERRPLESAVIDAARGEVDAGGGSAELMFALTALET